MENELFKRIAAYLTKFYKNAIYDGLSQDDAAKLIFKEALRRYPGEYELKFTWHDTYKQSAKLYFEFNSEEERIAFILRYS